MALLGLWMAVAATMAPVAAQTRGQVEAVITGAQQVLDQYVDVVDSRDLFTHGLRGLEAGGGSHGST